MQTIWKFELDITDEQTLSVPWGAEFLTVQMQGERLCLWAKVDPSRKHVQRTIHIYGTGNPIPDVDPDTPEEYVGSVQERSFVWHCFCA